MTSGNIFVGQGTLARPFLPLRVERQQSLADRLVERPGFRAVVEDIKARILAFGPTRFAFDLNLSDERGDGLHGIRHGKDSHHRQARVRQTRMNALTHRPDFGFARQSSEGFDGKIGHHVVKLAHQSLIRAEHDRANGAGVGLSFSVLQSEPLARFPESTRQVPVPRCDNSRPMRARIYRIGRCSKRPKLSSCERRIEDRRHC
jgi:hypothetical protein